MDGVVDNGSFLSRGRVACLNNHPLCKSSTDFKVEGFGLFPVTEVRMSRRPKAIHNEPTF